MHQSQESPVLMPDEPAPRGLWVVELPPELRTSDKRLQTSVARVLDLEPVRSLSVDGRRTAASIRLRPNWSRTVSAEDLSQRIAEELGVAGAEPPPDIAVISWVDPRTQALSFIKLPAQVKGWRRATFLAGAGLFLILGLMGILLPGLPTTPFVLLASYCLLRSSPALHERLLRSRLFGGVLRDWHLHRGIRPHVRYKALAVIALVVGVSLYFTRFALAPKLAIAAVAAYGIYYVWRLPAIRQ